MARLSCDVVVLGAGVNGMSTAYQLCMRGKDVVLVDRVVMGAGASGSCDDMILLQSKKPGILLEMAFRSLELFGELKDMLPCDIEFERRGGTILIEDAAQLSVMEDFVARQKSCGLDVDIVDSKRLRELQPLVSPHVLASTYSPQDSQVNPMLLMKGFHLAAVASGLRFLRRTAPVAIDFGSGTWSIELSSGDTIETGTVVNATGAWAGEICDMIGVPLPVFPKKGQVIVTEAIPSLGTTNVWSALYIVSKLHPGSAALPAEGARYGLGFAFTGTRSGNYLIGSTRENAGFDRSTDPGAIALIAKQACRYFPVVGKINFIRTFAGLRPSTPDGMPILGELPGRPGFFVAAGHEGDGIALAPITGRIMADLVEGRAPEFPLAEFSPGRFAATGTGPQGAAS